jgi:hypothetical protein
MVKRKLVWIAFLGLLPLAAAQQPPAPATAGFDAEAVTGEVRAFYASYHQAWDNRDANAIGAHLAADFNGYLYREPQGVLRMDKAAAMASVRSFFGAVRGKDALWRRAILSIEPSSATEAIAAVRNDFSLGSRGETELAVEVLRKGADGHWRLVRRWSEKHAF